MKLYLGGPMFVAAEVRYNLWLAEDFIARIRSVLSKRE